ncbi:MAG: cytochrome c, partial [Planctomycetes bacterium]|nr:cytochrome c [Planctomycetota bacterium]
TRLLFAACLFGLLSISYSLFPSQPTQAHPVSLADPQIKPLDVNMHDFMEGMFQAPYRRLKVSMSKEPADNAGWKQLRSDTLILAEGCNLLLTRLPEKDSTDWVTHSVASRDTGAEVYSAAKQKDYAKSRAAYEKMLTHCNACHKQFENGKHILEP